MKNILEIFQKNNGILYVLGHPNYKVSEDIEFVSLKTKNILIPQERNGYFRVGLDGSYYLVYITFWETVNQKKVPNDMVIDHIDGNKQNNQLANLRLVSQSENMKNAYLNGHKTQVSVKQYSLEGEYVASYPTIRAAAQAVSALEAGLKEATNRHGTCGGFYWLRENDPVTIEEVIVSWVSEGFTIIKGYPTYCINKEGQVYGKRNKKLATVHYYSSGKSWVLLEGKRVLIEKIMP